MFEGEPKMSDFQLVEEEIPTALKPGGEYCNYWGRYFSNEKKVKPQLKPSTQTECCALEIVRQIGQDSIDRVLTASLYNS